MTTASCPHHSGVEAKVDALCKKIELIADNQEKALTVAKLELERRLEGMNEFREQLSQQAATFIPRNEFNLQIEKLISRIIPIEKLINYKEGSRHWSDYIIMVIISALVIVLSKLFHI